MQQHSIEPRTRKYVKGYGFLLFSRKYKKLLDTEVDYLKIASQKVVHKANKFLGNKLQTQKLNANRRNVEEIIIPLEKIDEILNKLRKVS